MTSSVPSATTTGRSIPWISRQRVRTLPACDSCRTSMPLTPSPCGAPNRASARRTVSYTHLDVYKRQRTGHGIGADHLGKLGSEHIGHRRGASFFRGGEIEVDLPVGEMIDPFLVSPLFHQGRLADTRDPVNDNHLSRGRVRTRILQQTALRASVHEVRACWRQLPWKRSNRRTLAHVNLENRRVHEKADCFVRCRDDRHCPTSPYPVRKTLSNTLPAPYGATQHCRLV